MLLDITVIFVLALFLSFFFEKLNLPPLLGMIAAGIILGNDALGFIGEDTAVFLKHFKTAALIIILIRAGLGINKKTLKKIGAPAFKMGVIPCVLEGLAVMCLAFFVFELNIIEAGMLGFIIAAVSPAVVVPQMLELREKGLGKKKEVPTLILAGASLDDVFAITIFGAFVSVASGCALSPLKLAMGIPAGIIAGVIVGVALGFGLIWFFRIVKIRDTKKVIVFMIVSVLFYEFTEVETVKSIIPVAGLLGIMAIGYILFEKNNKLAKKLSVKFSKVWVVAEILLFVYIGSELPLNKLSAGILGVGILVVITGLTFRSVGVFTSLAGSRLKIKEKLFCVFSFFPKATVQAAIGAFPLTLYYEGKTEFITYDNAKMILAVAVLSIIISAPLGSILIRLFGRRFLSEKE